MCSVLNYLYSVSSHLYSVSSYIYSVSSYMYSISSYIQIQSHPIFNLILFVFSQILYIFSLILFAFIPILYSVSSYLYSVISFMYSVSSYFIQSSFLYSVSHTVRETNSPQVLSCNRFRNNQIELRKRQEYKNIKNKNTETQKQTKIQKIQYWLVIRILQKKQKLGKRQKNYVLYSFIYFIGGTVNFILMILIINQWYLEPQKPLVTLLMSKKKQKSGF